MSFVKIGEFLPKAFARIDRKNNLRCSQESLNIQRIVQNTLSLPEDVIPKIIIKNGTITFFTNSQILKHKIYTKQISLVKEIQQKHPSLKISKIIFKTPVE